MPMIIALLLICFGTVTASATHNPSALQKRLQRAVEGFPAHVAVAFDRVSASGAPPLHAGVNQSDTMIAMSTIKLPLAVAALRAHNVGLLNLSAVAHIDSAELERDTYSPLCEIYGAPFSLTLREFLSAAVHRSDNVATDVIVDGMGGANAVTAVLRNMGFTDVTMGTAYRDMHKNGIGANWATALGMNAVLRAIADSSAVNGAARRWLIDQLVTTPTTAKRLKGALPDGTVVAHKTGTYYGNTTPPCQAINDVGIIFMPNGDMLVCSVFVNNSQRSASETEAFIARLVKMGYDFFRKVAR